MNLFATVENHCTNAHIKNKLSTHFQYGVSFTNFGKRLFIYILTILHSYICS